MFIHNQLEVCCDSFYGFFIYQLQTVQHQRLQRQQLDLSENQAHMWISTISATIIEHVYQLWLLINSNEHQSSSSRLPGYKRLVVIQELHQSHKRTNVKTASWKQTNLYFLMIMRIVKQTMMIRSNPLSTQLLLQSIEATKM